MRANYLDRAKPGGNVTFSGILVVCPDVAALRDPKVKVQLQGEQMIQGVERRVWLSARV